MISRNRVIQSIYDATWGRLVFAGAYDWFIRKAEEEGLGEQRQQMLSAASGRTLEIATGTGLNIPHYPETVTELVLTEPYPPMLNILRGKVSAYGRKADVVEAPAENLPFPNESFDTVVGTMILCTAANPDLVLREVARILKPGGQYLFLEHIRNSDPKIARRQDRVQPAWFLFGNGCHCNRDSVETLNRSPLAVEEIRHGHIPGAMSIIEAMVTGRARRRPADVCSPNCVPESYHAPAADRRPFETITQCSPQARECCGPTQADVLQSVQRSESPA